MNYDEKSIDIIDIDDNLNIKENDSELILNQIRKDLLDETTNKLIENNKLLHKYNQVLKNYNDLKKEYDELIKKEEIDKEKLNDYNNLSIELIKLKKQNITISGKLTMVQSLLQLLINEYGIYEICEITRLTEEKIKDYLE